MALNKPDKAEKEFLTAIRLQPDGVIGSEGQSIKGSEQRLTALDLARPRNDTDADPDPDRKKNKSASESVSVSGSRRGHDRLCRRPERSSQKCNSNVILF